MKKLLGLLSGFMIATPLATIITSCSIFSKGTKPSENEESVDTRKLMQTRQMNWASVLTKDYSKTEKNNSELLRSSNDVIISNASVNESTKSTLANKDLMTSKLKEGTSFNPYTDIGIVEDSKEYLLKNKGLSAAYRDEAKFDSSSKATNNSYNDLGSLWNDESLFNKDTDGITVGFMQNASDEGSLVPMWDAAPNKTANQSAKWFQDRWDKWVKEGLDTSKVTISFGPFANSLWHEAYKNGLNEEEFADKLAEISAKYGTKKFDFYFAAPYLSNTGSYADSQRLLAGALKVLLERDNEFDIRLSLVASTKDGYSGWSGNPQWTGDIKLLNAEEFPLYMFTKYLGMNFRLNVVLPYLTYSDYNNSIENENWELDVMKEATQKVNTFWQNVHKNVNGGTISKDEVYKRMVLTPWIGKRAEKAVYDFDANEALELRNFASKLGIGQMSMFYLTRDYPSEFKPNGSKGENYADLNAIDQNLRSAKGYEKFTYAQILNGKLKEAPKEKTGDSLKKLNGFMDYDSDIKNNKSLDEAQKQQGASGGSWEGVPGGQDQGTPGEGPSANDGNVVNPTTPSQSNQSTYVKWSDANPNRSGSITNQVENNGSTYYSPYIDAGLYEGNDVASIQSNSGLNHLTLAFVQQVNSHNNSLDFSIAGIENNGEGYNWWKESVFYNKMLQPLVKSNNFENIKVAYGGATTGGYIEKNPWNLALKLANGDKEKASDDLKTALIKYNQDLATFVSSKGTSVNMPKNIDFDIEGEAQNDHDSNDVLAKSLAKMKKSDNSWNFSITLPVLPTGLTNVGYNVMDKFVKAYKEAGLSTSDLPVINLMLMDYGNGIYDDARNKGLTNFDLAKSAIENTKSNIIASINENYGSSNLSDSSLYKLIGATPMIGVNDTVSGVFTLEDAKELYNWAQTVGLSYVSMWSMNDDRGKINNIVRPKSLVSHGLGYLNEYDFAKAFNGKWDNDVKNPKK
ncbi:hypothetical protein [Spiroplasma turonicum]|uniref:Bifunctional chitinase/lysozyme n=1 Tax=Spiroplasma turonicum TaxID=216946 RepID=A0A0K1P684_9MOLU|nr:hypothetical protein [Spiroplasma turonicum]AKU79780.1 hypothetical protein STURON_00534 [Spiroplasma turonicum]ALX70798.1 bifunctional chitinase/lysozyme [Spiroplasma turonicum]